MEYYSAIKMNEIMPSAATWMELKIVILSEVSQIEGKYHITPLISGIKKETIQMTALTKKKQTQRLREQTYGCQGIFRELGMDMYTLLYLKRTNNKDLLYSTWNSVHCYVAA